MNNMTTSEDFQEMLGIIQERHAEFIKAIYPKPPQIFFRIEGGTIVRYVLGEQFIRTSKIPDKMLTKYTHENFITITEHMYELVSNENNMEESNVFFNCVSDSGKEVAISGREIHTKCFDTREAAQNMLNGAKLNV